MKKKRVALQSSMYLGSREKVIGNCEDNIRFWVSIVKSYSSYGMISNSRDLPPSWAAFKPSISSHIGHLSAGNVRLCFKRDQFFAVGKGIGFRVISSQRTLLWTGQCKYSHGWFIWIADFGVQKLSLINAHFLIEYLTVFQFGNTCYSNSVLQALYFCKPFREKVLEYRAKNKRSKETLLVRYQELYLIFPWLSMRKLKKTYWFEF